MFIGIAAIHALVEKIIQLTALPSKNIVADKKVPGQMRQ